MAHKGFGKTGLAGTMTGTPYSPKGGVADPFVKTGKLSKVGSALSKVSAKGAGKVVAKIGMGGLRAMFGGPMGWLVGGYTVYELYKYFVGDGEPTPQELAEIEQMKAAMPLGDQASLVKAFERGAGGTTGSDLTSLAFSNMLKGSASERSPFGTPLAGEESPLTGQMERPPTEMGTESPIDAIATLLSQQAGTKFTSERIAAALNPPQVSDPRLMGYPDDMLEARAKGVI